MTLLPTYRIKHYLPRPFISTAIFLGLIGLPVAASAASETVLINPGSIKWGDAPPSLPKGAKLAVLYGDPSKGGPFCIHLMAPAGYKIPPHWHSQAEALTVISGTFYLGMGDKMETAAAQPLKAGGLSLSASQGAPLRFFQGRVGGPGEWRRSVRHHLYQRRRRSAKGRQALNSRGRRRVE